jgi:hypothetical protein
MKMTRFLHPISLPALLLSLGLAANAAAAQSLAIVNGDHEGFHLEITEMKSTEGVLTLRGVVRNETQDTIDTTNVSDIYLIDNKNMKKYTVMTDSALKCVCSDSFSFEPNSSTKVWARFASPPDDVTAIGVVWGKFEPVDAVPLTK